jgi:hypothetical protein
VAEQPEQPISVAVEAAAITVYRARTEELRMNKWHVIHIIRKVRDEQTILPKGDWVVAAFALAVALALPLISADFKDALGVEKAVWKAVDLMLILLSTAATLGLLIWWVISKLVNRPRSEETIVQGIIDEMERERQNQGAPT